MGLWSKIAFAASLILLISAGVLLDTVSGRRPHDNGRHDNHQQLPGYGSAAVAADNLMCSTTGKDILLMGGNAVDAAIATLVCTGLGSPQSMGIGGGFFMTIYNRATGRSTVIDAREVAPIQAKPDMFVANPETSAIGNLSIAVPGEVKGYWYAHQRYGSLPWKELFKPSIRLATNGFPVSKALHIELLGMQSSILDEPSLRAVFYNSQTGGLYKEGEIIRMPELAKTLQTIADGGAAALYNGSLTDDLMKDLQDIGSIITREDLLNYVVKEKKPLEITLNSGMKVISPPAPSGGPVLSFILNVLDGFNFEPSDVSTVQGRIKTYHKIIETYKFAYAKRTGLGDLDFLDIKELLRNLTSREYADSIRALINPSKTFDYTAYGGTYDASLKTSTSHMSVLDAHGDAVSVTSTINAGFGSRRRGMRTGIIFNDEMDDFSTPNIVNEWGFYPSPANFIQPGKRPLSSMCPSIFVDRRGSVSLIIGAAGGSMITTSTAWVAAHLLWLGKNVEEAVNMPRLHHQLLPPFALYEQGFENEVVKGLTSFGHEVEEFARGRSVVQAINVWNHRILAKCDDREGGLPAGY